MGRPKTRGGGERRHADAPSDPSDVGLNLIENLQTRVSPEAKALVERRAKAAGQTPSAWLRVTIYKILGLNKER
jgi:hypothetical protein